MTMPTVPVTTSGPFLPASGAVIGLSDVLLALLFLSLGFGTLALVRTRNDRSRVG